MRFCSACAAPLVRKVPDGDTLPRYVCEQCGAIHYQNPRVVVGCIPEHNGRILLCLRDIEPRAGYWTFPAGFLENGETLEDGAARETLEEACARVDIGSLVSVVNVTHARQVHMAFRARLIDDKYAAGHETAKAELFSREDIPWQELAFPSIEHGLQSYFSDLDAGRESVHVTSVSKRLWRR